jgi:hypothetical protein
VRGGLLRAYPAKQDGPPLWGDGPLTRLDRSRIVLNPTRLIVAAVAIASVLYAAPADAQRAPRPTAHLSSCTIDPSGGKNVAAVTVDNARIGHAVRWRAWWVDYSGDYATGMRSKGRLRSPEATTYRFRFTGDESLKIVFRARNQKRALLVVHADRADGCGMTR